MYKLTEEEKKDHNLLLAYERTVLARDRTTLAVLRTALSSIAVGAAFIGFSDTKSWFEWFGWSFIAIGVLSFLIGSACMLRSHGRLMKLSKLVNKSR